MNYVNRWPCLITSAISLASSISINLATVLVVLHSLFMRHAVMHNHILEAVVKP